MRPPRCLLGHVDQIAVRRVGGHRLADVAGERLGRRPVDAPCAWQRRHHVQALAAGGLAEADAGPAPPAGRASRARPRSPPSNATSGAGSRSNTSRPGCSGSEGRAVPGVQLQRRRSARRPQAPRPGRSACRACGRPTPRPRSIRPTALGMAWRWKNFCCAADPVRACGPSSRAGPSRWRQHPRADRLEIARQVQLGHRPAVAGVRPQRLVGRGDRHAHDRAGALAGAARARRAAPRLRPQHIGRLFRLSRGAGISATTSLAGLSSRRPLNAACRIFPSPVNPAYSISATSSGRSQCTSLFLGGALSPAKGLWSVVERLQPRQ